MKFSNLAVLAVVTTTAAYSLSSSSSSVDAFHISSSLTVTRTIPRTRTAATSSLKSTTEEQQQQQQQASSETTTTTSSKKNERLKMMKKPTFHRNGFKEVRTNVEEVMNAQFKGQLIDEFKTSNYMIEKENVKVYLAKDFGFCWGVERSIALAYEAVEHFPDRKLHITNELIHNPEVHENLTKMNVNLLEKLGNAADGNNAKNFDVVQEGDVVILPAFGASYEEMELLDKKGVQIVDTTCPWVSKVWNTVDKHQKSGHTSIIHGKYSHEETVATTSFCEDYICVKNLKEAEMVANYIMNGGNKDEFLQYFNKAISKNFDPDTMLSKVGLANQTTMYKKETREIGQLLQKAMLKKYGPIDMKNHYMEFDTICDATQERQDAIHELVENADKLGLDFILVIGGFDSSNTAHLLEIPQLAGIRSYHINRADCITADNQITHRLMSGEIVTETFIPDITTKGKIIMGVTSGASTPDKAVQDTLSNIFMLKKLNTVGSNVDELN